MLKQNVTHSPETATTRPFEAPVCGVVTAEVATGPRGPADPRPELADLKIFTVSAPGRRAEAGPVATSATPDAGPVLGTGAGGTTETPAPGHYTAANMAVLARRVDALVVSYRMTLDRAVVERIFRAADRSRDLRTEVAIRVFVSESECVDLAYKCRQKTGSPRRFIMRNADVTVVLDTTLADVAATKWSLEIECRALMLARMPIEIIIEHMEALAASFGTVLERRSKRFDVCADIAGWQIRRSDRIAWQTASASPKIDEWHSCPWVRAHQSRRDGELTGHTVRMADPPRPKEKRVRQAAPHVDAHTINMGSPILLRVYDKIRELNLPGREEKKEYETQLWAERGRRSGSVTRVEFQIRTKVAREMGLRDPRNLPKKLDAVWQYCTQKWARMVIPDTASRTRRCDVDPRWLLVQSVRFKHDAAPIKRVRIRKGIKFGQVLGSIWSLFAECDLLPDFDPETGPGRWLAQHEPLGSFESEEKRRAARNERAFRSVRAFVTDSLAQCFDEIPEHDEKTLMKWLTAMLAARARKQKRQIGVSHEQQATPSASGDLQILGAG